MSQNLFPFTPKEPENYYPPGVYETDGMREIHTRILDTYTEQHPYLIRIRENGEGSVHDLANGYTFNKARQMIVLPIESLDQAKMGEFKHTINFDELASLDESERNIQINTLLWDDWNEQLEEPFISPADREEGDFSERTAFEFVKGTEEDMIEIVERIILSDPHIIENGEFGIQSSDADNVFDEDADLSDRSRELIGLALEDFGFKGYDMTYTDEMDDQRGGYYRNPASYHFDTSEIRANNSNRDILAAKNEMAEWLRARGLKPEEYL